MRLLVHGEPLPAWLVLFRRTWLLGGEAGGVDGVAVEVAGDGGGDHGGHHHRDHELESAVGEFEDQCECGEGGCIAAPIMAAAPIMT